MKKIIVLLLLLFAFTVYGADVKISNLPATTTLDDTDVVPAVYGTTTSKITVANLKTLFGYHAGVTLSTTLGANLLGLSTQQLTLDDQTANYVFAGPTTGEAAAPSFRALVAADIPSLVATYQPLNATLTALAAQTETAGSIQYYTAAATPAVLAKGTAYQLLNMNSGATAPAWTSTLGATGTRLTAGYFTDLTVTNAIAGSVTGNAGTATALAANPTDCSEGELATAIDASGNLTCGKAIGTDVQAYDSALTTLSSKVFAKTALTGAGGLDTVLYDDISDGDIGMVGTVAGVIYWYIFEASSATAESSPSVIAPDDVGANNGRWLLKLYCDGSSCSTVQGATGASSKWLEGSANGTDYMQLKADDDVGTNRKITLSSSVSNSEDLSIQLGANDNTVTIGSSTSADSIIGLNSYSLGSAGVKLTGDGDGAITFLGLGNGYDEDLTLNLDDTENTASISSSTGVTSIGFGAIGMVTTGTIQGAIKVNTDNNGMSQGEMTTAGVYGAFYVASGAGTWNLPAVASGMNICIYSTTAAAVVVNPDNGDVITLNGTALSAGDSITSASGAGDFICLMGVSDSSWLTLGRSGTWTDTN